MKNALLAMTFALTLSCTSVAAAQPSPRDKGNIPVNELAQSDNLSAADQSQELVGKWKEPTSTTVTVTSTLLPVERGRKKHWAASSRSGPSKEDWNRCLKNDRCDPRNLFDNQWDRAFGPAYDFGN